MESKIDLALLQGEVRVVTAGKNAPLLEEIPAKIAGCPIVLTYEYGGQSRICRNFYVACYFPKESNLHLLIKEGGTFKQRQIDTNQISYRLLLGISNS